MEIDNLGNNIRKGDQYMESKFTSVNEIPEFDEMRYIFYAAEMIDRTNESEKEIEADGQDCYGNEYLRKAVGCLYTDEEGNLCMNFCRVRNTFHIAHGEPYKKEEIDQLLKDMFCDDHLSDRGFDKMWFKLFTKPLLPHMYVGHVFTKFWGTDKRVYLCISNSMILDQSFLEIREVIGYEDLIEPEKPEEIPPEEEEDECTCCDNDCGSCENRFWCNSAEDMDEI